MNWHPPKKYNPPEIKNILTSPKIQKLPLILVGCAHYVFSNENAQMGSEKIK